VKRQAPWQQRIGTEQLENRWGALSAGRVEGRSSLEVSGSRLRGLMNSHAPSHSGETRAIFESARLAVIIYWHQEN
jgi:hypothetical protein